MVPPWVPPPPSDGENGSDDNGSDGPPQPVPIAPRGRFGSSRSSLGRFARSNSSDDMRRGVGHYAATGLGGGGTAARRFAGTAHTAGRLYGALSPSSAGGARGAALLLDAPLLAGRTADEVMDAVVEAVRPVDGTQDAEASRQAIREALSELLSRFPNADLLDLSEEEGAFVIERYVAIDVYNRFNLDVGNAIRDNAPDYVSVLQRFKEVKDYIRETVSAKFRQLLTGVLNAQRISALVSRSLKETFEVFAEYVL